MSKLILNKANLRIFFFFNCFCKKNEPNIRKNNL